jgi:hypothetical protein
MADTSSFNFVPGFDFLQSMVKNAGAALPSMGQWVVPTLDPAELERRIEELRTVQFWLDQNSRMLTTTIQALEVQRMTLSTLKGMNVTVNELHEALKVRTPAAPAAEPLAKAAPATPPVGGEEADAAAAAAAAGAVDAMQWWTALTQQFTQIASQAMQAAAQAVPETPQAVARKASTKQPAKPPAPARSAKAGADTAARASSAQPPLVKRASPRAKPAAPKA